MSISTGLGEWPEGGLRAVYHALWMRTQAHFITHSPQGRTKSPLQALVQSCWRRVQNSSNCINHTLLWDECLCIANVLACFSQLQCLKTRVCRPRSAVHLSSVLCYASHYGHTPPCFVTYSTTRHKLLEDVWLHVCSLIYMRENSLDLKGRCKLGSSIETRWWGEGKYNEEAFLVKPKWWQIKRSKKEGLRLIHSVHYQKYSWKVLKRHLSYKTSSLNWILAF